MGGGGGGGGGGGVNTACLLAGMGGGSLCLTSLCSTSLPLGEVGGKLEPSEIDVSSIAPTATVSSCSNRFIWKLCMHCPKQKTARQNCQCTNLIF